MVTFRRFLVLTVPALATCVALALSAGPASASVNVVQAVHQQDLIVSASGAVQRLRHLETSDQNNPRKLYAPVEEIAHRFSRAAAAVSHSSTDSSAQLTGKRDWVKAVSEIGSGFYRLGRALHDIIHGSHTNVARVALQAERRIQAGGRLLYKADHELGIRRGD